MNKKIITLICESLNIYDIKDFSFEFMNESMFYKMNLGESDLSAKALYLMQGNDNLPNDMVSGDPFANNKPSIFAEEGKFIANYVKTRIIANFWPFRWNPIYLDPKTHLTGRHESKMEPLSHHYSFLLPFLKNEFYQSDYQHLIYWTATGHPQVKCRVDEEEIGIPISLKKTAQHWFKVIQEEIMPLIDKKNTILLIHPDHGTARKNMGKEAIQDGFLYFYPKTNAILNNDNTVAWQDIRKTIRIITGTDEIIPHKENGRLIGE